MAEEKKLERNLGEEFYSGFYGKNYKVCRPIRAGGCSGCDFGKPKESYIDHKQHLCNGLLEETGECIARNRSDGQNVIFKEVKCKQ